MAKSTKSKNKKSNADGITVYKNGKPFKIANKPKNFKEPKVIYPK